MLEDHLDVFNPEYSLGKEETEVVGSVRSHRSKHAKVNPYEQVRGRGGGGGGGGGRGRGGGKGEVGERERWGRGRWCSLKK